jgi:hypothetical protein
MPKPWSLTGDAELHRSSVVADDLSIPFLRRFKNLLLIEKSGPRCPDFCIICLGRWGVFARDAEKQ